LEQIFIRGKSTYNIHRSNWPYIFGKKNDPANGEYWVGVYDSDLFQQRFQPYTLSGILSMLGIPASVEISTDGGPARDRNVPRLYVLLLYPDQGVLVRYTT
jgi:hypothetical protein